MTSVHLTILQLFKNIKPLVREREGTNKQYHYINDRTINSMEL